MQNAFKFSKLDGEVIITLSYYPLTRVPKPGVSDDQQQSSNGMGYLLTTVQDYGQGIPEADFNHLFTMFNSTAQGYFKTKGIGLGLSTAKALTYALAGAIHLNSKLGQGTQVGFSVMTQKTRLRINSKDLKAQMLGLKEDFYFIDLGSSSHYSSSLLSGRLELRSERYSSGNLRSSGSL